MTTANLQVKMDDEILSEARRITKDMGLDLPTAVRMFVSQLVRDRRMPFTPNVDDEIYSKENVESILKGIKDIKEGRGIEKSLDELLALEKAN